MQFKYEGDYCGPGWTSGRYLSSDEHGDYDVPPTSCLDIACQRHDKHYEEGSFRTGDVQFVADAMRCAIASPLQFAKAVPAALLMAAKAFIDHDVPVQFNAHDVQRILQSKTNHAAEQRIRYFRGPHTDAFDLPVHIHTVDRLPTSSVLSVVPDPPLIGIEPNPGPKVRSKSGIKKAPKRQKQGIVRKLNQIVRAEKRAPRMFAPVAYNVSSNFKPSSNTIRERGKIMLGSVNSQSGGSGAELYKTDCTPVDLGGMLSRMAELHERYRVHSFTIEWIPSVANNFAGQILLVYHYDPATWGQTYNNVSILDNSNARVAVAFPPREPQSVRVPFKNDSFKWRYCYSEANEPRTSSPGYFTVLSSANMTASTDIGSIVLHYDIEFTDRIVRPIKASYLRLYDPLGAHTTSTYIIRPHAHIAAQDDTSWEQFYDATREGYFLLPPWTQWDLNFYCRYLATDSFTLGETWSNVNRATASIATWTNLVSHNLNQYMHHNVIWTGGQSGAFKLHYTGTATPTEIVITLAQLPYLLSFIPLPALKQEGEEKEEDTVVVSSEPPPSKSKPTLRIK